MIVSGKVNILSEVIVNSAEMAKQPVVLRLFDKPPKMDWKMAQPGPIHGHQLPVEEEPAARVAFISDGILTQDKVGHLVKANRLYPDLRHDEPPILFRTFVQPGLTLTELAKCPTDPYTAWRLNSGQNLPSWK